MVVRKRQQIDYNYFKEELDKSNNLINECITFYDDILLQYIKGKDRDFKRKFRDSDANNKKIAKTKKNKD